MPAELPQLYQMNLSKEQLDMVGCSVSMVAATLLGNQPEYTISMAEIAELMVELGGRDFYKQLQNIIGQVAKLREFPVCPHCGNYHPPGGGGHAS